MRNLCSIFIFNFLLCCNANSGEALPVEKNTLELNQRLIQNIHLDKYSTRTILKEIKEQKKKVSGDFYQIVFNCQKEKCDLQEISLPMQ